VHLEAPAWWSLRAFVVPGEAAAHQLSGALRCDWVVNTCAGTAGAFSGKCGGCRSAVAGKQPRSHCADAAVLSSRQPRGEARCGSVNACCCMAATKASAVYACNPPLCLHAKGKHCARSALRPQQNETPLACLKMRWLPERAHPQQTSRLRHDSTHARPAAPCRAVASRKLPKTGRQCRAPPRCRRRTKIIHGLGRSRARRGPPEPPTAHPPVSTRCAGPRVRWPQREHRAGRPALATQPRPCVPPPRPTTMQQPASPTMAHSLAGGTKLRRRLCCCAGLNQATATPAPPPGSARPPLQLSARRQPAPVLALPA
jgi:hypothetical protein